jgi:pimeloyl-ACP methyl ester carboxylesterase
MLRNNYLLSPFRLMAANAETSTNTINPKRAEVNGLKLHCLTAGTGPAVILLHGYTQTSRMWRPLIPQLAVNFTVIAPDLPGIGDSDIPIPRLPYSLPEATLYRLYIEDKSRHRPPA